MQQKPQKKVPVRRCVGCNTQKPKKELVRIVRSPEGEVSVDLTGKRSGRGAYLCPSNTSNLRNISGNQTILRIIGDRPPMENVVRVQPTLEDLYLFYFKGGCEE